MDLLSTKEIALSAAGTVAGGAITWLVAWWYYKRAGDELREEARRLMRATTLVLAWLQNPENEKEIRYDEHDNPTSIVVKANIVG